ncbi:MAG TPA: ABC-three component system middle component 6 [Candidatus Saccharimonadales bacterium]|nr:ABC-three component system middle component 6 [Candidatus Saccharimonadales bacterium]
MTNTDMLISRTAMPENSVLYIAACALQILKSIGEKDMDSLYDEVRHKYNENLDYAAFTLALSFLFLVDRIKIGDGKIKCI